MKRTIILASEQDDYNSVQRSLDNGYVLDPAIHRGEPFGLENGIVYHLVFYENEDEKPKLEEEKKIGEFDDVEDMKDVPNAEVSDLLKQGYRIQIIYQKNTILLKRKETGKTETEKEEAPQEEGVQGGAEAKGGL